MIYLPDMPEWWVRTDVRLEHFQIVINGRYQSLANRYLTGP